MSAGRWVILISVLLALLLVGAFLLHPLVRFTACLYFERFDRAEAVYLASMQDSEKRKATAEDSIDTNETAEDLILSLQEALSGD